MYQTYGNNALQTPMIPGFNQGGQGYGQQAGYGQQSGYNQQGQNNGYGQANNSGNVQQQVNQGGYNLAQINELLADAPEQKNVETPTGTYQVKVAKVEMKYSEKTNNPMIFWLLEHISGEYAQATERLYDVIPLHLDLSYPENIQKLKKKFGLIKGRFSTCGIDTSAVKSIEGFQNLFPAVLDVTLEIRKMVKGENSNIYFNKRIFINGQRSAQGNAGNVVGFPGMPGGKNTAPLAATQQNSGQQPQNPQQVQQPGQFQQPTQNSQMKGHQNNQCSQVPQGMSQASQPAAVPPAAAPQPAQPVQSPAIRETAPSPINYQAPQGQMQQGQVQNGQFQQAPGGMPPMPPGMNQQMYQEAGQGASPGVSQIPGYSQIPQNQQQMQLPFDSGDEDEIIPDEFDPEDMPF